MIPLRLTWLMLVLLWVKAQILRKEVADIVLSDTNLRSLINLRILSEGLTERLTSSFKKCYVL